MPKPKSNWFGIPGKGLAKRYYCYNYSPANERELGTLRWKAFKKQVIDHYKSCALCGFDDKSKLQPHHKYYYEPPHSLVDYEISEMALLCEYCHARTHGKG